MTKLRTYFHKYFNETLDFRVRLFNVLALGGAVISLLMAVSSLAKSQDVVNTSVNFAITVMSFALLIYSQRTGRYQVCYMIAIVGIFIVLFPVLFFASGAYHGGMPAFFVFAIAFTVFMLEGKKAIFFSAGELVIYIVISAAAYIYPESVYEFASEEEMITDIVVAFGAVSIVLGVCMYIHFRMYNAQQRRLDEQNRILESANRMKTELFANVSHEMKTPLTVISVHIQRAEKLLEMARDGDEAKIKESFALAQDEIMRMSRLVNSALKLASMQEMGLAKSELDIGSILRTSAESYRTLLEKRGNALELDIPEDLPSVSGNADELIQIISNLLSNAHAHTQGGHVRVSAAADGETLRVAVEDDGEGISPELLPRVFERGMSDSGGSGLGLYICRELVRGHGGEITLESEPGKGAKAVFILPTVTEAS